MGKFAEEGRHMHRVKNRRTVNEVAKIIYRANWKRNLLSVFAIMLTSFMMAVVFGIGISYWNTISERQLRMEGMDYDIELTEPTEGQVKKAGSMNRIKYAGISVKCAAVLQYQNQLLDDAKLYWLDETCWKKQAVPALEQYTGTYPQGENEIMLSVHMLRAMGITKPRTGMKLSLRYIALREDIDEDAVEVEEPGTEAGKEFVLCGWFSDYTGKNRGYISRAFYEKTGVKQTDFSRGTLKITLKNHLYTEKNLLEMQEAFEIGSNQLLLGNDGVIADFIKMLIVLVVVLCMILISGYLFIYNTMYISISKDIRQYGQLKTIGMTSTQLRRVVYFQLFCSSAVGIPIGLLAAAGITGKIIPGILALINQELSSYDIVPARAWVYIAAGSFAFVTNLISSRKPAKIVGECSPVESLSYITGNVRVKCKKRENCSLFSMAFQNMFRDKKQAVIIFLSFIIGVSVFLTANTFVYENDAKHIQNETWDKDLQVVNQTTLDEEKQLFTKEKIMQIKSIPEVKAVRKVTSAWADIPYQEDVFGEYYQELYQTRYAPGNYKEDMEAYQKDPESSSLYESGFISIDQEGFRHINERLGNVIDWEAFERGDIAIVSKMLTEGDNNMTGKTVHFYLPGSSEPEKEHTVQIAAVDTDGLANPAVFSRGWTPSLIVSENYAKELLGELYVELINIEYWEAYSKATEKKVKKVLSAERKQISYDSKLELYSDMKVLESQAKVLGYSIGIIIALLVLLNYINMMAAGVLNRSKEFATLESIGMTGKQMRKVLKLEGAGYGILSVIGALPIGLLLSFVVFENTKQYFIPFAVPWRENLILFASVLMVCVIVPVIIYQRMYHSSIIEQLRAGAE